MRNEPTSNTYHIEYERSASLCESCPAGPVLYDDIEKAYEAAGVYSAQRYEPVCVYENNELCAIVENYGERTVSPTFEVRFTRLLF